MITAAAFERIRDHILSRGDRLTYCNMYNCNPHCAFDGFDAFLDPDVGQRNINCDPARSGFDVLVIRDWDADPIYYSVKLAAGALTFDPAEEPALAHYFDAMARAIAAR